MPSRRLPTPLLTSFVCHERADALADAQPLTGDVHPGWVRASQIILRGLARLESQERAKQEAATQQVQEHNAPQDKAA